MTTEEHLAELYGLVETLARRIERLERMASGMTTRGMTTSDTLRVVAQEGLSVPAPVYEPIMPRKPWIFPRAKSPK